MAIREYGLWALVLAGGSMTLGCGGFLDRMTAQSARIDAEEKGYQAPLMREVDKQDGYSKADLFALTSTAHGSFAGEGDPPSLKGTRFKLCSAPDAFTEPDYNGVFTSFRDTFQMMRTQGTLPSGRYFLMLSADLGGTAYVVSVADGDRAAVIQNMNLPGTLNGSQPICFWSEGDLAELAIPKGAPVGKHIWHFPATRWDGILKHPPDQVQPATGSPSNPANPQPGQQGQPSAPQPQ